ncbi:hypothetical protein DdX_15460 [Ditylenchus destructor]|uniref:Uncharacterized protein n=1 Tax=Ditylenchus destructor TaxID=166010 RepID=A0AAD4MS82_9BILA|nr:hypothetical protein DdX_15460 [Ditylenchus destructor]
MNSSKKLVIVEFRPSEKNEPIEFEILESDAVNGVRENGKKIYHYGIFRGEFTSMRVAKIELNRLKKQQELKNDCPILVPEANDADQKVSEFALVKTEPIDEPAPSLDCSLMPSTSRQISRNGQPPELESNPPEDDNLDSDHLYDDLELNGITRMILERTREEHRRLQNGNGSSIVPVRYKRKATLEDLAQEMSEMRKTMSDLLNGQAEILKKLNAMERDSNPSLTAPPESNYQLLPHKRPRRSSFNDNARPPPLLRQPSPTESQFSPTPDTTMPTLSNQASNSAQTLRRKPDGMRTLNVLSRRNISPMYNNMPVLTPTLPPLSTTRKSLFDDLPPLKKAI